MNGITADKLENWGREASETYLNSLKYQSDKTASPTLLNEAIEKIAKDNTLNREQIQRVCEFANIVTLEEMMKTASDRAEEFPVADARVVMEKVAQEGHATPAEKVASFSFSAYREAPVASVDQTVEFIMSGVKETMEKTAAAEAEAAGTLTMDRVAGALVKLAQEKEKAVAIERDFDMKQVAARSAMTNIVKDLLREGHSFADLFKAAVAAKPEAKDSTTKLFQDIAKELNVNVPGVTEKDLSLSKEACLGWWRIKLAQVHVNPELYTDRNFKVIKGGRKLQMALRTYYTNRDEFLKSDKIFNNISDAIENIRKKVSRKIDAGEVK